jgi:D-glycero-alpha-D-manno-heptose-7-phosphate kinase
MLLRSSAPVRVDFSGGWTDVALFAQETPGHVVNAALNIYSYATIVCKDGKDCADRSVNIYSSDFDLYVEAEDIRKLEYDGSIDLAKAALKRIGLETGLTMITQSVAPPGSGLGTSASMGVALIAALARLSDRRMLQYEVAEMASLIERQELGILGGKQDHYASALGGLNFMEFRGEDVKTSPLPLSRDTLLELEKNLLIIYTGKSRLSGDIHGKVTGAWKAGEARTVEAIRQLKRIAVEMKEALLGGDLDSFGKLMDENWNQQKRLHPSVTNPQIDRLFEIAYKEGALGGKACGAGGGGCIMFYCRPDCEHKVQKALEAEGVRVIDFNFDGLGVQTWNA